MQNVLNLRKDMAETEKINFDAELVEFHENRNKHLILAIITIIVGFIMFISSSVFTGISTGAAKGFFA